MKIKPFYILYLAMVGVGMGQTVIFAVMPMLGRELHLHELVITLPVLGIDWHPKEMAITLLSALTAMTFSMSSPFWGRASDKFGRKPIITIGMLGYTLGMLLFAAVAWLGMQQMLHGVLLFLLLIITRIIHSSLMSAAMPASNAYIVDITTPQMRHSGLGKLSASMQIGMLLGPVMAYLMMFNYLLPFVAQSLLMLLIGVWIVVSFPYHKPEVQHKVMPKLKFFDQRFAIYLLLMFLVYLGMGMVQQTLGFYVQDVLHLSGIESAKKYSIAMLFSSLAMLVAQLAVVPRIKVKPQQFIRGGIPFIGLGFATLAIANSLGLITLGMILFGFGMGLAGPSFSASASQTVNGNEQGALAGLMGSVSGLGFVFGPLLGGYLYGVTEGATYAVAAVIVGLPWLYVMLRKLPAE